LDLHLRGSWVEGGAEASNLRALGDCLGELFNVTRQLGNTAPRSVLQLHAEARHVAVSGQWRRTEGKGTRAGDGGEFFGPLAGQGARMPLGRLALLPWFEPDEHESSVGKVQGVENV